MFPVELLSPSMFVDFAIGAAIGAVLYGGFMVYRDRDRIGHRWQRKRRLKEGDLTVLGEPEEYEGFIENPLSEEERSRWPWHMSSAALAGGAVSLGIGHPSDGIFVFLAIAAALPNIVSALLPENQAELIESKVDEKPRKRLIDRIGLIGGALLTVLFAFLVMLDDDIMAAFRIEPGTFFAGTITLFALAAIGFAAWRARFGPPDDADPFNVDEYQRETFIVGATGSVILAVAILIWLA
jgi:hypothetical protein